MLRKKQRSMTQRNRISGYLFLLPNIIGFAIFVFLPVIASFFLSFMNWNGFGAMKFVGLDNYARLLKDENFKISFMNSIIFTLVSVPFTLFLSLIVAVWLNAGIKFVKWFRTAVFLPYITATIAVAVIWQLLLNPTMGPINGILSSIGFNHPPGWLSSPQWALLSVALVYIWNSIGYYMVLYLAGLQGVPEHLYEAADIDGAGSISKFFHITLPMLSPVIFFTIIIGVINSFKVFDLIFVLTQGGPGRSTQVLVYTIYNVAFKQFDFGYASAMAYILFLLILVFSYLQFRGQKKWVNY
ncbi:sugar ABC transporter permease [Paenibacillus sp. HB172176]|uniref:carbohydrate ABC transporter permease n=1 Tax=Paenibacillus sp. HB172176 TaxID=2493690 RepID=UPI001F0E7E0D|nr:sugar ABC transporter permease [Paenibacillus sp. HB172176]